MFDDVKLYAWQHNVKIPVDVISVDKDNFTAYVSAKDGYKLESEFIYFNSIYYTRSKFAHISLWRLVDANGEPVELVKQRIGLSIPVEFHENIIAQPAGV